MYLCLLHNIFKILNITSPIVWRLPTFYANSIYSTKQITCDRISPPPKLQIYICRAGSVASSMTEITSARFEERTNSEVNKPLHVYLWCGGVEYVYVLFQSARLNLGVVACVICLCIYVYATSLLVFRHVIHIGICCVWLVDLSEFLARLLWFDGRLLRVSLGFSSFKSPIVVAVVPATRLMDASRLWQRLSG